MGCRLPCYGVFKPTISVNMVQSLDAVRFFSRTFLTPERSVARTVLLVSLQARYVSNQRRRATRMRAEPKIVVCSTSLGNVKSGEHGRKDICLDLMVVMACHRF